MGFSQFSVDRKLLSDNPSQPPVWREESAAMATLKDMGVSSGVAQLTV